MPGFNPENINIHDLTIEEPEKEVELLFDPGRDLTQENWQEMEDQLEFFRDEALGEEDNNWRNFLEQAMIMKVLNPDINIKITKNEWQLIKKEFEELRKKCIAEDATNNETQLWGNFTLMAMRIKMIDPKMDLDLDERTWQGMEKELSESRAAHEWDEFSEHAIAMKMLYPKKQADIKPEDWDEIQDNVDSWREAGLVDHENNFFGFSRIAARLKILDPTKVQLSKDDWDNMKKYLTIEDNDWSFANQAMFMKILAAQKVEITDKGLEVVMQEKEPSSSEVPEMPEKRKF